MLANELRVSPDTAWYLIQKIKSWYLTQKTREGFIQDYLEILREIAEAGESYIVGKVKKITELRNGKLAGAIQRMSLS